MADFTNTPVWVDESGNTQYGRLGTTDPMTGLTGDQRDAYTFLKNQFEQYGLGSLAPVILQYLQQGFSSDTIAIELQQTDAYKQRFAANAQRIKDGLSALSPAEYIATERSYRQIMSAAGLPVGFYDSTSDFQKFLEKDVSPTELQARVQAASDVISRAPSETIDFANQWYSTGDLVAYALDPTRAEPLIEQRLRAAEAAAYGKGQGLTMDQQSAEIIGRDTNSIDQVQQAVSAVANQQQNTNYLQQIYGGTITPQDVVKSVVENDAESTKKIRGLASKERASFGGSSAFTNGQALSKSGGGNL